MADASMQVEVSRVTEVSEELVEACRRLVPQLTDNNPPPTKEELEEMLSRDASTLFIARVNGGEIIGLASLVLYRVPTGLRGYIEDVVVDERWRGKRTGELLTKACLELAEKSGATQVMLTSNPGRQAANRLYQRMGFELRMTNVYRYSTNKDA